MLRDAGGDLVAAEFLQLLRHEGGCFVEVEVKFRDAVQMPAPAGDLILHFSGTVQDRHFLELSIILRERTPRCFQRNVVLVERI